MNGFNLYRQIIRHRGPVGFVFLIHVVPEGLALGIKHHHGFRTRKVLFNPPQHADYAFDGASRVILAGGQWRQGMVGTEQVRRSVHQNHGRVGLFSHIKTGPDSD